MSTLVDLPGPKLHPRSLGYRNTVPAGPAPATGPVGTSPFTHDTCPDCGFDGDVAVVLDRDQGLMGWECPDCRAWITTRDMEDES